MTRKDFIKNVCTTCLSVTAISVAVSSCSATRYVSGNIVKDGLTISKDEFLMAAKTGKINRSFVIIRNDALLFPICLYRFSEQEYSALWMRCTHQGSELQASGDSLQCSAHGSEFNSMGHVTNGPADNSLRSFPVQVKDRELFIDLRKQS